MGTWDGPIMVLWWTTLVLGLWKWIDIAVWLFQHVRFV